MVFWNWNRGLPIWLGSFERTHDFEQIPDRFVRRLDDQWIKDDFSDEICMVLDGEKGQTVIVGCSIRES